MERGIAASLHADAEKFQMIVCRRPVAAKQPVQPQGDARGPNNSPWPGSRGANRVDMNDRAGDGRRWRPAARATASDRRNVSGRAILVHRAFE